ncbi:MAG: tetratricopeptide repeat protein [Desulfobacteraceae bacterium]|nr:tetratricopeptide repeat protein [Desulfobacteraceae bacterium]MBC2718534.1 tetratricopeptide repeat protein [Desulfobacteraceae bacterium]
MTKTQQKLYVDRDSAGQFLVYKTDSKIPDIKYDTKFSASQTGLLDEFPGMLTGKKFINYALAKVNSSLKFGAIVIRIDNIFHSNEESVRENAPELFVKVAKIIDLICKNGKGLWGQIGYDMLGWFCFEKNGNSCMELAHKAQKNVEELLNETISTGMAFYPTTHFNKHQILDNALKALDHAAFLGPNSAVAFDAVSLNISGDKLYQKGDINGAINEFKTGLLLDPLNANLHNSLGVCYGVSGSFEKAKEEFETSIWLDSNDVMALYNSGLVNLLMDNKDRALELFLEAKAIGEDVFEVEFQLGKLYLESGKPEKGKKHLEKAVGLRPESGAAFRCFGDCSKAINKIDEAIASYKKAIKLNPNDADSLSNLGSLFDIKDENAEIATILCRQSVDISPDNGLFRHRLGRLYFKQNQYEDAMKEFQKANDLGCDSIEFIDKLNKPGSSS